jgi:hypothetical protein
MPESSGEQFYEQVVVRRPELANRIVFCTGDTVSGSTREFIARSHCLLVSKPFNVSQLAEAIGTLQARMLEEGKDERAETAGGGT